jgi:hypothetical protein
MRAQHCLLFQAGVGATINENQLIQSESGVCQQTYSHSSWISEWATTYQHRAIRIQYLCLYWDVCAFIYSLVSNLWCAREA